ncbi:cytochrome P450 [Haematococcus lacustris]
MNSPRLSARARFGHRALVSTQQRPRLACRAAAAEPPMLTLPGLQHLPVAGYLLELRKDPAGFYLRVQEECMKQGLEAARTDLGPISLTYLYSQRHVQHVLQDSRGLYTKSDVDRRALGLLIGNGLLLNEGEPHRQRRRIMMPCFTAERLDGFVRDMVDVANESVRRLQALQQQQPQQQEGQQGQGHGTSWQVQQASGDGVGAAVVVDIHAEALRCALSIIGRCGFSSDIGDSASEIGKALEECLSFAGGAMQAGGTAPLRQAGQQQRDLLDMLLLARNEDGSALGDSELRDEVMTMVTAGHETSANVLAWAMYQLALHPEAVHHAVAEVHAVCGPGPEAVQPHHLPKLRYLEAVLQETLRLHPPVWAFDRQAAQQDELPGGVQIVQGSYILLSPYALHRQPDLFPEPDAFKPERFLEGGSAAALPRFQYIPFGGGGRSCIGSTFAMYEMKVLLATWLQAFPHLRLHPSALPVEAEASVTYRPRRPLTLVLSPNTDRL